MVVDCWWWRVVVVLVVVVLSGWGKALQGQLAVAHRDSRRCQLKDLPVIADLVTGTQPMCPVNQPPFC